MKKIFTLALGMALVSMGYSQSQRLVLIEEGSNASCAPCAAQNPAFNTLLGANEDKVVSLKYQWYFPGYDPMYEHNPDEADGRFNGYYGQNGVPTAMIDGEVPSFGGNPYDGAPAGYSQAMIDDQYAVPASFDIDVTYSISPDEILIDATATCTQDVSGNLKMRVAVIEKTISFDSAPGSNGEMEFHNVMKKFLPNMDGIAMEASYVVNDEFTTSQSWGLANIYDYNEVAVVIFIQDDNTKEVLQAALAEGEILEPTGAVDATPISTVDLGTSCESVINPTIEIRNNGSETLTSLDLNYDINGTAGTVNWTGSLEFMDTEMVQLGDIAFTSDDDNTMVVTVSNPNGTVDENPANDAIELIAPIAAETTLGILVTVHTDLYAVETTWEIRNEAGDLVASGEYEAGTDDQWGGGGPDANTTHVHHVVLEDEFECHTFTLYDSFDDGMGFGATAATDQFGYEVTDGFGNPVISLIGTAGDGGLPFGSENENVMKTNDVLSINDSKLNSSLNLYPNPTNAFLNVAFELEQADHITIDIVNLAGQVILSKDLGTISTGYTLENIDVANLSSGFYLVKINTTNSQVVRKITITE